ncbi:MAG: hypothetical protein KAI70_00560 [Candidatus Omnitrophica bacterium]|nr:hypothetical protein [Candidatus Omnitrophota bacterium]
MKTNIKSRALKSHGDNSKKIDRVISRAEKILANIETKLNILKSIKG